MSQILTGLVAEHDFARGCVQQIGIVRACSCHQHLAGRTGGRRQVRDSLAALLELKAYGVRSFESALQFLAAAPSLPIAPSGA